jgi:hypothetical protein
MVNSDCPTLISPSRPSQSLDAYFANDRTKGAPFSHPNPTVNMVPVKLSGDKRFLFMASRSLSEDDTISYPSNSQLGIEIWQCGGWKLFKIFKIHLSFVKVFRVNSTTAFNIRSNIPIFYFRWRWKTQLKFSAIWHRDNLYFSSYYNVRISVHPNELIASLTEPPASILAPPPACPVLATCINCISCL